MDFASCYDGDACTCPLKTLKRDRNNDRIDMTCIPIAYQIHISENDEIGKSKEAEFIR